MERGLTEVWDGMRTATAMEKMDRWRGMIWLGGDAQRRTVVLLLGMRIGTTEYP